MLRIRARRLFSLAVGAATFMSLAVATGPSAAAADPTPIPYPVNPMPVHMDVSPPLALLEPPNYNFESVLGNDRAAKPVPKRSGAPTTGAPATPSAPSLSAPTPGVSFDGIGVGLGSYLPCCAPPDTNATVGPSHIFEVVNLDFAIWNKTTLALLKGPVAINTVWSGFGGGCQTNNDGDPTVLYDSLARRWLISQFSVTTLPYLNCVAVSTGPDPLGTYYRYAYSYGNVDFIDYPKFGIWPDGYYVTFNVFANGVTFTGAKVCAYDRNKILTGASATQQCFNTNSSWGGLLPSTVNGVTPPPTGAPNFILGLDTPATSTRLAYWNFHVDWTTPANTTMTGPSFLTVSTYTNSCSTFARGDCIPQGGRGSNLESLADRLMYALNYRNLGDHAALVVNHTIEVGSGSSLRSGVRWYELRPNPAHTALGLFQEGTYSGPSGDTNWRWMGSVNMDKSGNIAMGYSVSSPSIFPQIHYTGRLVADPAGTMTQGENMIVNGGGAQTNGLARWGDYSSTAVDPVDDCTFFHANEYLKTSGSFNWSTRIGSFTLPNCLTPPTPDFTVAVNPSSQSANRGTPSAPYSISVSSVNGFSSSVALSTSMFSQPAGGTGVTFTQPNPASVTPSGTTPGTSSFTASSNTTATPGQYTIRVTATGGAPAITKTSDVTFTVVAPDFNLSVSPSSQTVNPGATSTPYNISVSSVNGFSSSVALATSMFSQPAGGTGVTFTQPNPGSVTPSGTTAGTSSFTATSTSTATPGQYTIRVTATGGTPAITKTSDVTFTVTSPDFNLSVSPTTQTLNPGVTSAPYNITVSAVNGFASGVALATSMFSQPAGGSGVTFTQPNPASVTPSGTTAGTSSFIASSTSTATPGQYTIRVTATSTSPAKSHTFDVTFIVAQGDFSLSGSPSSLTVKQGATGNYLITITRTPGFTGAVTFSVSGLPGPAGATSATFSPNPSSNGSTTLTVGPSRSTPTGSFVLTVTGVSGSLTHTTTVTLVVTQGCFGGDGDC
jgi:hypothetical protein